MIEGPELTSVNFNEILDVYLKSLYCIIITGQSVTDILCTSVSIQLLRSFSAAVNV